MLPFLKPRNLAAIIITKQNPEGKTEDQPDQSEGLKSAAADLLKAIAAQDADAVASALEAAYEICDQYDDDSEDDSEEGED